MSQNIMTFPSRLVWMSFATFLFQVLLVADCTAKDYLVRNSAETELALKKVVPGDSLVMADGVWKDQQLRLVGQGKSNAPITLRAQTPGKVVLTGASQLEISGRWLVVDGLRFENGALGEKQHIIRFTGPAGDAEDSRLTNTAIVNYNPSNPAIRYFWVSLYGKRNRVDHNLFSGQNHAGVTLCIWRKDSTDNHLIEYNYFLDRAPGAGNGFETIRIGGGDAAPSESRTIIQHNLFERTNGEGETISIKAGGNEIRYNTFHQVAGTVTLRKGNNNRVIGNIFLGDNAAETGGIRIAGENQMIADNYLQDIAGQDGGGIVLLCGSPDVDMVSYPPVRNTVIANNTLINIKRAPLLLDRRCDKPGQSIRPEKVSITNNLISSTSTPLIEGQPGEQWNWTGNVLFGAAPGIPAGPGITIADPKLAKGADGLWRRSVTSPAINAATAAQSTASATLHPLTAADVGPAWKTAAR